METVKINIARDYSDFPAGRYKEDDHHSGDKFRDEFLIPNLEKKKKVIIDFNGVYACLPSFLEEAFGGLIRKGIPKDVIDKYLSFADTDEQKYKDYISVIKRYIKDAAKHQKG